jgi:hypothetical protein
MKLYNLRDMRELRKNFNAEGAEVFSQSSLRKKVAEKSHCIRFINLRNEIV